MSSRSWVRAIEVSNPVRDPGSFSMRNAASLARKRRAVHRSNHWVGRGDTRSTIRRRPPCRTAAPERPSRGDRVAARSRKGCAGLRMSVCSRLDEGRGRREAGGGGKRHVAGSGTNRHAAGDLRLRRNRRLQPRPAGSVDDRPSPRVLLHQGDEHHRCHIVLSGSADIRALGPEGQCVQIATVEPGEIFGSYPGPGQVRANVQAQSAMELVSLDSVQLSRLALDCSEVGAGLARIFAGQLGNVLDRFAARVTLTATGRVYALLLEMDRRARHDRPGALGRRAGGRRPRPRAKPPRARSARSSGAASCAARPTSGCVVSPRMLEDLVI